jgi:hypothetical protein
MYMCACMCCSQMFAKMDTSQDGTLQPNEFKRGLRQLDIGANVDTSDIARYIQYSPFTATVHSSYSMLREI